MCMKNNINSVKKGLKTLFYLFLVVLGLIGLIFGTIEEGLLQGFIYSSPPFLIATSLFWKMCKKEGKNAGLNTIFSILVSIFYISTCVWVIPYWRTFATEYGFMEYVFIVEIFLMLSAVVVSSSLVYKYIFKKSRD